jgi:hypothetical protein
MSNALNLFPARVRWSNADGTLTVEALRMLEILVSRVGGTIGDAGSDVYSISINGGDAQQSAGETVSGSDGGVFAQAADTSSLGDMVTATACVPPVADPVLMQAAVASAMLETIFQGGDVMQSASSTAPLQGVAATASPMAFVARDHGALSVQGGTVSLVTFARGGASITLGLTNGLIQLSTGDKVTVTYSAAPTLTFIPR